MYIISSLSRRKIFARFPFNQSCSANTCRNQCRLICAQRFLSFHSMVERNAQMFNIAMLHVQCSSISFKETELEWIFHYIKEAYHHLTVTDDDDDDDDGALDQNLFYSNSTRGESR